MQNLGNVICAGSPHCYEQNRCAGEWSAPLNCCPTTSDIQLLVIDCDNGNLHRNWADYCVIGSVENQNQLQTM